LLPARYAVPFFGGGDNKNDILNKKFPDIGENLGFGRWDGVSLIKKIVQIDYV